MGKRTPQRQTTKGCAPTQRMLPGLWRWYREPCSIEGCDGVYWSGGLCEQHYNQERHKRRYAANPEYFKEQAKRWQAENRERYRARKQQHHQENPRIVQERNRRYYEANQERLKEASRVYGRQYYQRTKEAHRARKKAWYLAHPEAAAEHQRRRRAWKLATAIVEFNPELLAAKLAYYGGRCWLCGGEPTGWDHVKPLSKGGAHTLANLRPACQPCNSRKRDRWPFPTARRF